jgi:hypothetical protein
MVMMLVDIQQPIPAEIGQSYIPFGFRKFGLCCWTYEPPLSVSGLAVFLGGYDGQIEWINTEHFITQSKLPNPVGFRYWLQQGCTAIITPVTQAFGAVPDIQIGSLLINPVTGKGMPLPANFF